MSHGLQDPGSGKKTILVVTSQVVRGAISGRGLVFALERLGHTVWFLPTILLPWHPGHGPGHRIVPPNDDFGALVDDLIASDRLGDVDAVISGYLGDSGQADVISRLVAAVKSVNPKALYLCDPVMGDHQSASGGGLYVPEARAEAIRDTLVPAADIVTPNSFELGWLTSAEIGTETEALQAARYLGNERVLVTSAPALRRNAISNLLVAPGAAYCTEHAAIQDPPHGTGDLIAGLFLSAYLDGAAEDVALTRAAAATFEIVARSVKREADELLLAQEQQSLVRPMALVSNRRVLEAARA
ncbi:Pyridoxal kinase [Roseibium hamelinense]|uniref:pyridoxal kinase n=1 Tax=Roseibium hamelinense TaxID=150831 RepID=A0A562SKJ2_9HYPH|nr:pyridoxal kinase [Roseibium hamelinense]MTI43281.1 pyridoxal kinase [Roseibium hamelinense]TWI81789.1 Pyridoxal kinase [Roseibium hamelinense]